MDLFGRRTIYVEDNVNELYLLENVNRALAIHYQNKAEMDFLYNYRRGLQPILGRTKERNSFINNKIVENHADEIVAFKNGFFLTQPAYYIARGKKATKVKKLNEYLYRSGKHRVDNELVNWFHTVGKAVLFVEPDKGGKGNVCDVYSVDPRNAFVAYSLAPGNKPVMGVNCVEINGKLKADVYTKDWCYRLSGSVKDMPTDKPESITFVTRIDGKERNVLGKIPLVEYFYNDIHTSAFEIVVPLLDELNKLQSNRMDGVEQFIQSLMIATNVDFEEGVTANQIKESGMICLKSTSDNKASIQILSEQLDQAQTQTLTDYIYQQILTIAAMPNTTKGGSSTSDTGAAVLYRDGWEQASAAARNTEDLFKASNAYFDEIFLELLRIEENFEIDKNDFELQFVRNETANIQSKAQACYTMMSAGLAPELAFAKSGISNDPVSDVKLSEEYLKARWKTDTQEEPKEEKPGSSEEVKDERVPLDMEQKQTEKEKISNDKFTQI